MGRTLSIGDIHGGLKALKQLLHDKVKVTTEDTIIFLGDYVDGWSDSANVVSYLIELAKDFDCIFIRGNHDDLTHQYLKSGAMTDRWVIHGGQSSIDGYAKLSSKEIQQHLLFFSAMQNYYIDDQNRLFVHAGFTNLHGPENEYYDTGFYWDRTLWEMAISLDPNIEKTSEFYPKRLQIFDEIFIGHTPVTRIGESLPVNKASIWNIDTGAAFKGSISALDINTKEVWQSDPVYTLYPNEDGRN
ncbi:metallophosphoesterase [Zunongwangia profunda]|jgi:serine/threonine protein phosphatase 1|uniref:Serine/threonine protein phosphatase n=1 Tax=Zunongwangia profunda TaxID=398743 RepID=A0A3D5IZZ5_9FLAO|nr:metallophosphoesterase [Zunongwangia profunda]MAC64354.1 serine/threonine protein phosphatase [Flavobacteriaceae bacterium]MAS71489.1 serine/threonine protein phosphatase [Zunongwangia sp.]MAG87399.1 serine/threonine protein phosphatase [Flavobacteriaceae bacterium]HAJ81416.1 serine/threonine protein phosphatase [Zunongwangia profunda]HCV81449.1 serine/threonine protein phosphatase [Zunongwangia profunda]|tara:strand:+ start:113 stop:844 length:732 start_codon:yes stop_codon:yes gene_type:complete